MNRDSLTELSVSSTETAIALPLSLAKLIETLRNQPNLSPDLARQCLLAAGIQAEDLMPWATFDHPATDSYGRRLVYETDTFEIMVMSWVPGDWSAIHDHGCAQWGAVQCFGAAEHYAYRLKDRQLQAQPAEHYTPGSVQAIDRHLIHQMGNPGPHQFLSLHLYGCDRPCHPITGNARIFDLLEGCVHYTQGGAFFCLPEEQITRRQSGICGDYQTIERHHQQMRDRIRRILAVSPEPKPALQDKLAQLEQQLARF